MVNTMTSDKADKAIVALKGARLLFAYFLFVAFCTSEAKDYVVWESDSDALLYLAYAFIGGSVLLFWYLLKRLDKDTSLAWAEKPDWLIAVFALVICMKALFHIGFKPLLLLALPIVAAPLACLFMLPALKKRADTDTYVKWSNRAYLALAFFILVAEILIMENAAVVDGTFFVSYAEFLATPEGTSSLLFMAGILVFFCIVPALLRKCMGADAFEAFVRKYKWVIWAGFVAIFASATYLLGIID